MGASSGTEMEIGDTRKRKKSQIKGKKLKVYKRKKLSTATIVSSAATTIPMMRKPISLNEARFKTRTSPSGLYKLVRGLSDVQKEAVKAIGFGSLLSLSVSTIPVDVCRHLVSSFDFRSSSLILSNGDCLEIDEEDVQCVLNLPRGDIDVMESIGKPADSMEYLDMLKNWRRRWLGSDKGTPLTSSMPAKIKANTSGDDDFKRDFVVYVVSSFLWTSKNSQCRFKVLKSLMDVDRIKDLNWCKFTLDGLIDSVDKWQQKPDSYFYGPQTFLMLCYMDRVMEYTVQRKSPRIFPIISCWDDKSVGERRDAEFNKLGGFGRGRVVERIQLPSSVSFLPPVEQDLNVNSTQDADTASNVLTAIQEMTRVSKEVHDAAAHLTNVLLGSDSTKRFVLDSCKKYLLESIQMIDALNSRRNQDTVIGVIDVDEEDDDEDDQEDDEEDNFHLSPVAPTQSKDDDGMFPEEVSVVRILANLGESSTIFSGTQVESEAVVEDTNLPQCTDIVPFLQLQEPQIENVEELPAAHPEESAPAHSAPALFEAETSQEYAEKEETPLKRPKRKPKQLPAALRSPYITEVRQEFKSLKRREKEIVELVFSGGLQDSNKKYIYVQKQKDSFYK